jgi:hypothetical protein
LNGGGLGPTVELEYSVGAGGEDHRGFAGGASPPPPPPPCAMRVFQDKRQESVAWTEWWVVAWWVVAWWAMAWLAVAMVPCTYACSYVRTGVMAILEYVRTHVYLQPRRRRPVSEHRLTSQRQQLQNSAARRRRCMG